MEFVLFVPTFNLIIDREAREIMHLAAFVCPSVLCWRFYLHIFKVSRIQDFMYVSLLVVGCDTTMIAYDVRSIQIKKKLHTRNAKVSPIAEGCPLKRTYKRGDGVVMGE